MNIICIQIRKSENFQQFDNKIWSANEQLRVICKIFKLVTHINTIHNFNVNISLSA